MSIAEAGPPAPSGQSIGKVRLLHRYEYRLTEGHPKVLKCHASIPRYSGAPAGEIPKFRHLEPTVQRYGMQPVLLNVQYILCTVGRLPRSQDNTQWTPVRHLNLSNDIPNTSPDVMCGLVMEIKGMRTPSEMRDWQPG